MISKTTLEKGKVLCYIEAKTYRTCKLSKAIFNRYSVYYARNRKPTKNNSFGK